MPSAEGGGKRRGSEVPLGDERPAREAPKRRASSGAFGPASSSSVRAPDDNDVVSAQAVAGDHGGGARARAADAAGGVFGPASSSSSSPPAHARAGDDDAPSSAGCSLSTHPTAGGGGAAGRAVSVDSSRTGGGGGGGGGRISRVTSASPAAGRTGSGGVARSPGRGGSSAQRHGAEGDRTSFLRTAPPAASSARRAGSSAARARFEDGWSSSLRSAPPRSAFPPGVVSSLAPPVRVSSLPSLSPRGQSFLQSRDLRALAAARAGALGGRVRRSDEDMIDEGDEDSWNDWADEEWEVWVPCGLVLLLCLVVLQRMSSGGSVVGVGCWMAAVAGLVALVAVMPREERQRWYARMGQEDMHVLVPVTMVLCAALAFGLVASSLLLSSSSFDAPAARAPLPGRAPPSARQAHGPVARLFRVLRRRYCAVLCARALSLPLARSPSLSERMYLCVCHVLFLARTRLCPHTQTHTHTHTHTHSLSLSLSLSLSTPLSPPPPPVSLFRNVKTNTATSESLATGESRPRGAEQDDVTLRVWRIPSAAAWLGIVVGVPYLTSLPPVCVCVGGGGWVCVYQ